MVVRADRRSRNVRPAPVAERHALDALQDLARAEVQAAQVDRSVDGTAVRGAAHGAAAGAAIGAIAGDAGKGAAIGAVAGGLRGRRSKVVGDEMEQQYENASAQAQEEEMMKNFNKAFTACMEAKDYTVK